MEGERREGERANREGGLGEREREGRGRDDGRERHRKEEERESIWKRATGESSAGEG